MNFDLRSLGHTAAVRSFAMRVALLALFASGLGLPLAVAAEARTLNTLFIGNSFTGRHNLSQLVKAMVEAGEPGMRFEVTTVIYGGRTLKDHWRLGTADHVKLATLTLAEARATLAALQAAAAADPNDNYARSASGRHEKLIASLSAPRRPWDLVVLQSYRDDGAGAQSPYLEYAEKFAALARAQGARVVLYETTPLTQHAQALTAPPDPAPVRLKAQALAAVARRHEAIVVPMSTVALHCQTVRPDLTLRYVNDAHLNQTMAYLTACTFYAALFDRSPEGLSITAVTDTRFFNGKERDKNPDGAPITRVFSPEERLALQRIAWEGLRKYQAMGPTP